MSLLSWNRRFSTHVKNVVTVNTRNQLNPVFVPTTYITNMNFSSFVCPTWSHKRTSSERFSSNIYVAVAIVTISNRPCHLMSVTHRTPSEFLGVIARTIHHFDITLGFVLSFMLFTWFYFLAMSGRKNRTLLHTCTSDLIRAKLPSLKFLTTRLSPPVLSYSLLNTLPSSF